ncbi:MAG: toprim domain-containing protein [bacterium]
MENTIEQLAQLFLKFPGIGNRQAKRFAHFIASQPEGYVYTLADTLTKARANAHTCTLCKRIFEGNPGICQICTDIKKDPSCIVVVEKSPDIDAFRKTDYNGIFFVLGGLIPIVQKDILQGTNITLLTNRIKTDTKVHEVILAFPLTPNGDHTDSVVREIIAKLELPHIKISSLGRGLASGTELEYADPYSLNASLKKRE